MKLLIMFLAAITIASCSNQQKKTTEIVTAKDTVQLIENKIMIPSSSCYSSISGNDTVLLKVEVFPNVVTGKISYKFFEKDSNTGEFDGQLHGDTMLANYTFMSEGKLSSRQVIFLIKDSLAIEGYGNMEMKDGNMVFKSINNVSFGGRPLKKIGCGEY